jgi:putative ABC transport system permease protein
VLLLLDEPIEPKPVMRPYALLYLYRRRLRQHAGQELLAGLGVAVAVALVFATLVANGSIGGSSAQVVDKVVGHAALQLRTIGPEGFDEGLLSRVEALPGVKQAAPLLETPATIVSPRGRRLTVSVVGIDVSLAVLDGLAHTVPGAVFSERAVALSSASAQALHIAPAALEGATSQQVTLNLRGRASTLKVSAILGPEAAGALSQVLAAAMPLESLQALAGLKGRVSRILVEARPGRRAQVRKELQTLAGERIAVVPADQDIALLREALRPSDLASTFFAAVAALLGFLFAFNSVLLTVPERRQAMARLRLGGAKRSAIVQLLLFQALCLGIAASIVGLAAGYALSVGVFHQRPVYLAQAFVLGGSIVVGIKPVLLALAGGVLATCLASMVPALDLRRGRALDAVYMEDGDPGHAVGRALRLRWALAALLLLALASVLFVAAPSLALVACLAIAVAVVLAMPLVFAAVVDSAQYLARRSERLTTLPVVVMSLRRTTLRSLALVITGAVALFGAIALSGSRGDLFSGFHRFAQANAAAGEIWVLTPDNVTGTSTFLAGDAASRMARVPGVASVRTLQGGFLDVGDRRILVLARPGETGRALLRTQVVAGSAREAERRLREGGWVAVSQQLAAEHHAGVGAILKLPTPTGTVRFRVAALTTDLGWPGGAVLMNTRDFRRLWETDSPTALVAEIAPGTNAARARRAIAAALGAGSGLEVMTADTWLTRALSVVTEGLSQLQWISVMLVVAAILAMAAALTATIWEQRPWLSGLRLSAVPPKRLRRILLTQSALTLGAGCLAGALAGVYGQVVLDAYLEHVTGFPVTTLASGWRPLAIFAVVIAVVLAIAAIPVWFASHVSRSLALENE